MSRLVISQKKFVEILKANGFTLKRTESSHQTWQGLIEGRYCNVQVDSKFKEYSGWLLNSMMNQSGLTKQTFRR